jgi:hypothetical protein
MSPRSDVPTSLDLSFGPAMSAGADGTHGGLATRLSFGAIGFGDMAVKLLSVRVYVEYRAALDRPSDQLVIGLQLNPVAPAVGLVYAAFAAAGPAPAMYGH